MGRKYDKYLNCNIHKKVYFLDQPLDIVLKTCKGELPIKLRVSKVGEFMHIRYKYFYLYHGTKGDDVIKKIRNGKRKLPKWLYNIAEKINNQ